jgi:outer membrane autotransporter protein
MGPEHEAEDIYGNDFNLWMDTNYKTGEQDDDDLAIGYDFNTYNFTIGGDMFVADWLIGAAISYGDTDVEYNSNSGESEVSSYSIAGYAKYSQDEFFWDTTLSLSISDMDNERTVNNTDSSMDSSSDGLIYSLSSQIGYEFQAETTYFTPIAGLSYTKSQIDGVNESGSIFAVTTDDQDYDSVQSKLGFRTGLMNIMDNEDYYILEMRAFWYHEFMDTDRDLNARFNAGGDSFNVAGIENETESFLLGLGWKYEFDNTELKVDYDYEMSSGFTAHKIGVSWVLRF